VVLAQHPMGERDQVAKPYGLDGTLKIGYMLKRKRKREAYRTRGRNACPSSTVDFATPAASQGASDWGIRAYELVCHNTGRYCRSPSESPCTVRDDAMLAVMDYMKCFATDVFHAFWSCSITSTGPTTPGRLYFARMAL